MRSPGGQPNSRLTKQHDPTQKGLKAARRRVERFPALPKRDVLGWGKSQLVQPSVPTKFTLRVQSLNVDACDMNDPDKAEEGAIVSPGIGRSVNSMIRKALAPPPTKAVIDGAYSSSEFSLFLEKVRQSPHHLQLLTLHRVDLFGADATSFQALLFLASQQKPKGRTKVTTEGPSKALEYAVTAEIVNPERAKDTIRKIFGVPPEDAERVAEAVADVIAFFLFTFIRTNPVLLDLVNSESFSFAEMKKQIPSYTASLSFVGIEEKLNEVFAGGPGADPELNRRVQEVLLPLILHWGQQGLPNVGEVSKMLPNMLLTFHLQSQAIVANIIDLSGITFEEYIDVVEDMHIHKLIQSYNVIHWCENCSLEIPLIETTTGKINPSKLSRKRCMNCQSPMSFSAFYSPTDLVKDALFCKDGFLAVLFGWCLRRENVDFTAGEYAGDVETDFIITRPGASTIVEVKTFKKDKDEDAVRSELGGALAQLGRQLKAVMIKGAHVDRAFILWNRDEGYNYSDALATFEKDHPGVATRVFNHHQIDDAIKEAKRP